MENDKLILISQFCLHHQAQESFIVSLSEFGLIKLLEIDGGQFIDADELTNIEKMVRLHDELGINLEGLDAIFHLLSRIEILQKDLIAVRTRLLTFAPEIPEDEYDRLDD